MSGPPPYTFDEALKYPSSLGAVDKQFKKLYNWVGEEGFDEYWPIFIKNKVDLDALIAFTDADWNELSEIPIGERKKMKKMINSKFKKDDDSENEHKRGRSAKVAPAPTQDSNVMGMMAMAMMANNAAAANSQALLAQQSAQQTSAQAMQSQQLAATQALQNTQLANTQAQSNAQLQASQATQAQLNVTTAAQLSTQTVAAQQNVTTQAVQGQQHVTTQAQHHVTTQAQQNMTIQAPAEQKTLLPRSLSSGASINVIATINEPLAASSYEKRTRLALKYMPHPQSAQYKGEFVTAGTCEPPDTPFPVYAPTSVVHDPVSGTCAPLSDDVAVTLMQGHVADRMCYGAKATKTMTVTANALATSVRARFSSFAETRRIDEVRVPYKQQILDDESNGTIPALWSVDLKPLAFWAPSTANMFLAHSQKIVDCGRCHAMGHFACPSCNGTTKISCKDCSGFGLVQCMPCMGKGATVCAFCRGSGLSKIVAYVDANGRGVYKACGNCSSGKQKCIHCKASGKIKCGPCDGKKVVPCNVCMVRGRVQCFECQAQCRMLVQLRAVACYSVVESSAMLHCDFSSFMGGVQEMDRPPASLIDSQKGNTLISVKAPLLTEAEIASTNLRLDVQLWFTSKRIYRQQETQKVLFQSFVADAIPLYRLRYKYQESDYHFWVVGAERIVWENDYPHTCGFCRCSIQ